MGKLCQLYRFYVHRCRMGELGVDIETIRADLRGRRRLRRCPLLLDTVILQKDTRIGAEKDIRKVE